MKTRFDWDPVEAAANERKHGVDFDSAFDSALVAFADPFALLQFERVENGEQRWQTIGAATGYLLLLVVHTIRETMENGEEIEIVRIISARKADRSERRRSEDESR